MLRLKSATSLLNHSTALFFFLVHDTAGVHRPYVVVVVVVVVVFALNRALYPAIPSAVHAVSDLILHPREETHTFCGHRR